MSDVNITGSSAIVTGGASGIGEAVIRRLARAGAHCVILDMNAARGGRVADEVGARFVQADVADSEAVGRGVATAMEAAPLRFLVNAAGIGAPARTVDRDGQPADLGLFEHVIRVNLIGTFNCLRLAAAAMATTEPLGPHGARGAIVNVASLAAFEGQVGQASYSASKAGIVGMTLPIARDLASIGVRVNTVAPGLIDTPVFGQGEAAEAFKARLAANALFPRRLGSADEVASVVEELLTNGFLNAETIRVDGGVRLPPR